MSAMSETPPKRADRASHLALRGLLVIGLFVGYEWLMSGVTKLVRGGFPSGLADELREKSEGVAGWYGDFLNGTVIPNGRAFGVLIEVGELAIGAGLIIAAIVLLARWDRLSYRSEMTTLAVIDVASLGATLMNVAFHLANGSAHPWLVPQDGFDEGVDLDSLLPLIQLVFVVIAARLMVLLRREHVAARLTPARSQPET